MVLSSVWLIRARRYALVAVAVPALALAQGDGPLSLDEAVTLGLARSLRLTSQSLAVQAAAETVDRARELPDPKLRFGLENLPVTDSDRLRYDRDFMTMRRIGVMQEFPHGEKRDAARMRAHGEAALERAMLARERVAVRRDTALAWLERAYAEATREQLVALDRQLALELDATAPALLAGRTSAAQIYALRGMREAVHDRLIAQERMIERARVDLERLIGIAAARPLAPLLDTTTAPLSAGALAQELDRHPLVAAAAAQARIAAAELQRARATGSPDWAVELSFARREPAFSNMVSLMFQVELPVFKAQRQDRDVAARVASLERARALIDDARRSAEGELRLYLADHTAAQRRVSHHRGALAATMRERAAAATAAYAGGKGSLAEVLEARRAETEIALDTLAAERERAIAWGNLRFALLDAPERAELDREE